MFVGNHFTRQYNPEDNSEHHTRRRENLKSHNTETNTNIYASSGIRTHDPSNQAAKTYSLHRAANGTGLNGCRNFYKCS
jgi:hypothetical protein